MGCFKYVLVINKTTHVILLQSLGK